MEPPIVTFFRSQFSPLFRLTAEEVHWLGSRIPIPSFTYDQIDSLLKAALWSVQYDPSPVVDVTLPAWIVGDLHGNLHDLVRILTQVDELATERIVFLGDYVDRGHYSLEVILLLFTLKVAYPSAVTLLRGNHEVSNINEEYGFKQEIADRFPDTDIWPRCNQIFAYLPLAADFSKIAVGLHGGIGPHVPSITTIASISLPIDVIDEFETVSEILWGDPTDSTVGFLTSARGRGSLFGKVAVVNFLKTSGHRKLIRAHECVTEGFAVSHRCFTIFSSSNYCDRGNSASFLYMSAAGEMQVTRLYPMQGIPNREQATFADVKAFAPVSLPSLKSQDSFARRIVKPPSVLAIRPSELKGMRRASLKGIAVGGGPAKLMTLAIVPPIPDALSAEIGVVNE
jgi:protein phosphatase